MWLRKDRKDKLSGLCLHATDIYLRPAVFSDYAQWVEVRRRNQSYLQPFEPAWPPTCLEPDFFKRRIERLSREREQDKTYAFLVFTMGGDLSGGININNVTRGAAQMASLGYWIDEAYQGKGYMSQATNAVLYYAFSSLMLSRMNAATLPHNYRSRAMLQRLGFVEEGFAKSYIQINGARQDHILYGLNATDFLGSSRYAG